MKPLPVVAGSIVTIVLLVSGGHAERVGLTDTWVDDTRPLAYRIESGSNEFHATGEICSLMQTFIVEGPGVKVKFRPKSSRRGRYEYSGRIDGVEVDESGAYEVLYDGGMAFSIVAGANTYRLRKMPGGCSH